MRSIFQTTSTRMGKRRPGVAEDLMSSTAEEWKAMLAAPEVENFITSTLDGLDPKILSLNVNFNIGKSSKIKTFILQSG